MIRVPYRSLLATLLLTVGCGGEPPSSDTGPYDPTQVPIGWGPDGELVVHHQEQWGSGDVRFLDCGGSGIHTVVSGRPTRPLLAGESWCEKLPRWTALAPDGRTLFFGVSATEPGGYELESGCGAVFRARLGRERMARLRSWECRGEVAGAAFSPDGRRLAVVLDCRPWWSGDRRVDRGCATADGHRLVLADTSGGRRREVVRTAEDRITHPAWSSDGRRLAWTEGASREMRVVIADTTGENRRILGAGAFPAWHPAGEWVAAWREVGDQGEFHAALVLLRTDGGAERTLFENPDTAEGGCYWVRCRAGEPFGPLLWSVDGEHLIFVRDFEGGSTLWSVDVDGDGLRRVSSRIEMLER